MSELESVPIGASGERLTFGEPTSEQPRPPLRRLTAGGALVWSVSPPEPQDSWVSVEVHGDDVVAHSWSCWRVVLDGVGGVERSRAFTK